MSMDEQRTAAAIQADLDDCEVRIRTILSSHGVRSPGRLALHWDARTRLRLLRALRNQRKRAAAGMLRREFVRLLGLVNEEARDA